MKWTARDVENALRVKYGATGGMAPWTLLREVTISDVVAMEERLRPDGREPAWRPAGTFRRIDLLMMRTSSAPPVPYERIAVEIKVSRADFLRETPEKRRAWQAVAHRFAYAAPRGLIAKSEVPEGCGLIEVADPNGPWRDERGKWIDRVAWRVRAPRRLDTPRAFDDRFVAYVVGRASRAEQRLWDIEREA